MDPSGNTTTASYAKANELATVILKVLSAEEASIGYGLLACSLTVCRLLNPGRELGDSEEIKFIENFMDWSGAYFTPQGKGN